MRIAFKEWAIVCRALASGRQIVILRKGGIVEEGGTFRPDHPEFLLFPTYSHQSPEQVVPGAWVPSERLEAEQPDVGRVVLRHCATVTDLFRVEDLAVLRALRGEHIWSDSVVEERFHRWRDHSAFAIIVRVATLHKPVTLDLTEEYTGCKSWVRLEEEIDVEGAHPVVSNEEFARRAAAIRTTLSGAAH